MGNYELANQELQRWLSELEKVQDWRRRQEAIRAFRAIVNVLQTHKGVVKEFSTLRKEAISSKEGRDVKDIFIKGVGDVDYASIRSIAHKFALKLKGLADKADKVYLESTSLIDFSMRLRGELEDVFNKQVDHDKSYAQVVALLIYSDYFSEVGIDEIIPMTGNPNHYPYSYLSLLNIAAAVVATLRARHRPKHWIVDLVMNNWIVTIVGGAVAGVIILYIQSGYFKDLGFSASGPTPITSVQGLNMGSEQSKQSFNSVVKVPFEKATKSSTDWSKIAKKAALDSDEILLNGKSDKKTFEVFINGKKSGENVFMGAVLVNNPIKFDIQSSDSIERKDLFVNIMVPYGVDAVFRDAQNNTIDYSLGDKGQKVFQYHNAKFSIPVNMKLYIGEMVIPNGMFGDLVGLVTIDIVGGKKQEFPFKVVYQ